MVKALGRSPLVMAIIAALALGDAAGQLLIARRALERGDLDAAEKAYRRAIREPEATTEQRRQAIKTLAALATDPTRATRLVAFLQEQLKALPPEQHGPVLEALVVCLKARDGSLREAFALLKKLAKEDNERDARHVLSSVSSVCGSAAREVNRLARELRSQSALRPVRHERVPAASRSLRGRSIVLREPRRPAFELRLTSLPVPSRARRRRVEKVALRTMEPLRYRLRSSARVAKPAMRHRPTAASLARVLYSRVHRRALELAGEGFFEAAKAQYATFMELFPDSSYIQHIARYALQLFRRERGAAQETSAMVAYLRWLEAVFGPKGHDYAEYLAFRYFADDADPVVVAREAEAFMKRHPGSSYLPAVRLELAVALDSLGEPRRAIEVLRPLATNIATATRAKAAYILAWLLIFQGQGDQARQVLQTLASQTADEDRARAAKRLLEQMAAHPLPKASIPELPVGVTAEEALAKALLHAGDTFLKKGDFERAMDLYDLFLHLCEDAPGYYAARLRIERLKQTGKLEDF